MLLSRDTKLISNGINIKCDFRCIYNNICPNTIIICHVFNKIDDGGISFKILIFVTLFFWYSLIISFFCLFYAQSPFTKFLAWVTIGHKLRSIFCDSLKRFGWRSIWSDRKTVNRRNWQKLMTWRTFNVRSRSQEQI